MQHNKYNEDHSLEEGTAMACLYQKNFVSVCNTEANNNKIKYHSLFKETKLKVVIKLKFTFEDYCFIKLYAQKSVAFYNEV